MRNCKKSHKIVYSTMMKKMEKVIQNPHEDPDQHQTLITSTGSFLAHPYHVSSTFITVIVSYLPTDRQNDRRNEDIAAAASVGRAAA